MDSRSTWFRILGNKTKTALKKLDWISITLIGSLVLSIYGFAKQPNFVYEISLELFCLITFGILSLQFRKNEIRFTICEGTFLLILWSLIDGIFWDPHTFDYKDFIAGFIILFRLICNLIGIFFKIYICKYLFNYIKNKTWKKLK